MRQRRGLASVALALVFTLALMSAALAGPRNFNTHLTGDQEAMPNDSRAQGQAIFKLNKDGTELSYKLIVANIENVIMAHIHCAPAGVNGPVVVWLHPSAPPAADPTSPNGVLATGTITDASIVNISCGATLAELVESIDAGDAYVNVHTTQLPNGEIRGQLR